MHSSEGSEDMPLFVLATRLYVRFKFKTRRSFDPQRVLVDDAYAREVLMLVRATRDAPLLAMADRFERARFGGGLAEAPEPQPASSAPLLDLPLESPG